jgi:hypothetical protein
MPFNKRNSAQPLFSSLLLVDAAGTETIIKTTHYLEEIELTTTSDGAWLAKIVLFDGGGDYLEQLTLYGGLSAYAKFRFGYEGDGEDEAPLFVAQIVSPKPTFTPQGIRFELDLVSAVTLQPMLTRKPRSFPAGLTATEIVATIVDDYRSLPAEQQWKSKDRRNLLTIQPSVGTLEEFSSSGESDIAFIREKILPRAVDADKNGFVFYFDEDNAVHFHSINYGRSTTGVEYPLVKSYVYARDSSGDVLSFDVSDNVIQSMLMGAGDNHYLGVDSEKGTATEQPTDALSGVDGSKLVSKGDTTYRAPSDNGLNTRIPVVTRTVEELALMSASRFSRLQEAAYSAELVVMGTHEVRAQDYISIRYLKADGSDHYLSGIFKVMSLQHTFNRSGFVTKMTCQRSGTKFTQGAKRIDTKKNPVLADSTPGAINQTAATLRDGGTVPRRSTRTPE